MLWHSYFSMSPRNQIVLTILWMDTWNGFCKSFQKSLGYILNILQATEDDKYNHLCVLSQSQNGPHEHYITGKLIYLECCHKIRSNSWEVLGLFSSSGKRRQANWKWELETAEGSVRSLLEEFSHELTRCRMIQGPQPENSKFTPIQRHPQRQGTLYKYLFPTKS